MIKRTFAFAPLVWCFSLLAGESGPTFHPSPDAAYEVAAADGASVLLVFGASWCPYCKKLKETTLASTHFHETSGPLRIVQLDIELAPPVARAFKVTTLPTLILLTPEQKLLARRTGFLNDIELLSWLAAGQDRNERGLWDGVDLSTEANQLSARPGSDLDPETFARMIAELGDPNPTRRAAAASVILEQREKAVPALIHALGDPYLGSRIAASELLLKLVPDRAPLDPWQSPSELSQEIGSLRKWWAETGTLPEVVPALDRAERVSIENALKAVREGEGVSRTEGMSILLTHGLSALPSLRASIQLAERGNQPQAVALLEDVRWAILVPEALERSCGGLRRHLARGSSGERQAAATRLARGGRSAIKPLSELVNDADPLVIEAAMGALSKVGGNAAIPALAALLGADDANLRMTAAQALGRGKNTAAAPQLIAVLADENEVVACTALSALEELFGSEGSGQPAPEQVVEALRSAMQDARWRVRATAAEVAGKVRAQELSGSLLELLDDSDGFVVKNTLLALNLLGSVPDTRRLTSLARRLPSLRAAAIQVMASTPSPDAVQAVTELYEEAEGAERELVIRGLAPESKFGREAIAEGWQPLLAQAAGDSDVRLRRTAADLLSNCSSNVAAGLVGPLLADEDAETRAAAANAMLNLLAGRSAYVPPSPKAPSLVRIQAMLNRGPRPSPSAAVPETAAVWRSNLVAHATTSADLEVALGVYVLGDARTDLPPLAASVARLTPDQATWLAASPSLQLMLTKLPWPEGQPLLEQMCRWPHVAARLAVESGRGSKEAADFLRDPAQLKLRLDPATGDVLDSALTWMLSESVSWSLMMTDELAREARSALWSSTNAGWRAAALFAMSKVQPESHASFFEQGLGDPNPLVRVEAVKGFRVALRDREALEERLGPLLAEPGPVARAAALALLQPEVLRQSGLEYTFFKFQFGGSHSYRSYPNDQNRPLIALASKPAFLEQARERLDDQPAFFGLLLAQYGDFGGVQRMMSLEDDWADKVVFTAIALSKDPSYVPFLRQRAERMKNEYELQAVLQALRLMEGTEARELRLEVNRRARRQTARF